MSVPRMKLRCPWCGARLRTMKTAERVQARLAPGSPIEKRVFRCPGCAKIVRLGEPSLPHKPHRAMLWGAWALALTVAAGVAIVAYLLNR